MNRSLPSSEDEFHLSQQSFIARTLFDQVEMAASGFQAALKSKGIKWITFGWLSFIAENIILSENRTEIIERFGSDNYHHMYNTLSTLACGSIAWGYFKHGRKTGPTFRMKGSIPGIVVGTAIQTLGFVGLFQLLPKLQVPWTVEYASENTPQTVVSDNATASRPAIKFAARCPMDFRSMKGATDDPNAVVGLERITRYPFLWIFSFATVGNAMSTIFWTERVMFAFPTIFAYIGSVHQDSRFKRGIGGYLSPEREQKTSLLPFVALAEGRQSWNAVQEETKGLNALCGVAIGGLLGIRRILKTRI